MLLGNNDGRSEYNSLQVRLQRQIGALRVLANYTWSKSLDNDLSTATGGEGNGFAAPLDSFNEALDRGRSNFDIPQAFTMTSQYTLPIGKGHMFGNNMPHWADTLFGGWDVGSLWIWESGSPFTVSSGRNTGPSTVNTWADYTGSRNIGSVVTTNNGIGPGVYYFTPDQIAAFAEPAAGTIGSSGRNTFRGPRFFNLDASLVEALRADGAQNPHVPRRSIQPAQQRGFRQPGRQPGRQCGRVRQNQRRSKQSENRTDGSALRFLTRRSARVSPSGQRLNGCCPPTTPLVCNPKLR